MSKSTTLVAVAGGLIYHSFAMDLMRSARRFFKPTESVSTLILEGLEGWPIGTACRYRILLEAMPRTNYVFLIDADMLLAGTVGPEILPPGDYGITATLHPGYVGKPREELPYETRENSAAYVAPDEGGVYYCGGFIGGTRTAMSLLCAQVAGILELDKRNGLGFPVWHDESCVNAVLAHDPPTVTLPPSYTYPDHDDYYRECVWTESYERRIVALDKTVHQRGARV